VVYELHPLKIGVIGTGHMGQNHVRNLAAEKKFDLVGVYDINISQAKTVAEKFGTAVFDDIDRLLDSIEAVVIAVPSSLHKEVALKAAAHGVHALVEKPLATNLADAETIADSFSKRKLKLSVGHIERFNPVFMELQKLIQGKKVFYIEACRYSPFSGSGRITDTSVVEDLMIHDIDLVCSLMNGRPVTSIHGRGETVLSGQTDFATCLLDWGGQAHAIINASRISQNKERVIKVHTSDCYFEADLLAKTLSIAQSTNITIDITKDTFYKQDSVIQKVYIPVEEPLKAELLSFYDAVVSDKPMVVTGEMGIEAIKICQVIAERAKKNQWTE
jgi:predicted dehydrogenase